MMKKWCCSQQCGVTLAEVIVTLFVVSIVGVSVLAGIYTTINSNVSARISLTAESLARSELEYVLSQPYDSSSWTYSLPGSVPPGWGEHVIPAVYSGYSLTVTKTDLYGSSSIQQITVNVKFNEKTVMTMSTYRMQ